MELNFHLHPGQLQIHASKARFKVISAGRRFGKTYYAVVESILKVLEPLPEHVGVWHIAPTLELAKDTAWPYVTQLGAGLWTDMVRHEGKVRAPNGRWLQLKGSDRPESLLGRALGHVCIDEYASMRPNVWEHVIRPSLSDAAKYGAGTATFIGSPDGKNHFYEMLLDAEHLPDWEAFQFVTADNPHIPQSEIEAAKQQMSHVAFQRQFMASFIEGAGQEFKEHQIVIETPPERGNVYIAVDPAGYSDHKVSRYTKLDETAIAVVRELKGVWYVLDIQHGRWNIRETSLRIMRAAQKYKPVAVGIEKGSLERAIMPYLKDQMARLKIYPPIRPVTHGNQQKQSRIVWALQGRLEHGRIKFAPGDYVPKVREQLLDFPSPKTHDDLIDALAYIDQICVSEYSHEWFNDNWQPIDEAVGY